MTRPTWDERIARARELAEIYSFAAEVLAFYASVADLQRDLYLQLSGLRSGVPLPISFRDSLDLGLIMGSFPRLLRMVQQTGPAPLAARAAQLEAGGQPHWDQLLTQFWNRSEDSEISPAESFFARAFLQPYAEHLADLIGSPAVVVNRPTCPACDSEPVVAVLRAEGFGAKRSLVCSFCSTEWDYVRAVCPGCGEDDAHALCVYTAEQFAHVRVDACDTCKTYIKTVDLSKNGLAIPVVDEIATLPLTLWAQEHGYTKLQPNLVAV